MSIIFGRKHENVDYQLRKGVYAVIVDEAKEKILAIRTSKGDYLLPGGGIETNENDEECLKREMLEETGYTIAIESFIGNAMCYFISTSNVPQLSHGYFYNAKLLDWVQEPVEEDHLVEWVGLEHLEEFFVLKHHIWAINRVK